MELAANELIERFRDFIEKENYDQLMSNLGKGKNVLVLDFSELIKHDLDVSNQLLDDVEDTIKAAELAVENLDDAAKDVKVRFKNLPASCHTRIVDNRVHHMEKLVSLTGEVSRKSKVYMDTVSAQFECPACGNIINVLTVSEQFKEPTKCGCGRKGRFTLVKKDLVDVQELTLIDSVDSVQEGDMYQELTVVLKNDLTSPEANNKIYSPNNTVIVNGYFEEVSIILRSGGVSRRVDKVFIANYIEPLLEQDKDFYPTEKDINEFKELAKKSDFYDMLVEGIAPTIYGHDRVKEALLLQLVGGVRRIKHGDKKKRGDIHLALIGDPSVGKSELMLRATDLLPRSMFVIGKGASAVGIAGGVKKNSYVEGYTADPGAMAMANKSILGIDELDKFDKEDIDALNTGMEQQFIKIDKGGVHAKYEAATRILVGANPKLGRFDPFAKPADQFGISPAVLSRLDLIFLLQDKPDEERDKKLAEFILNTDTNSITFDEEKNPFYNTNKLRKFIQATTKLEPEITEIAKKEIVEYYAKVRAMNRVEDGVPAIAIAPRQLQALERLAEASAKIFFKDKVMKEDAQRAISIMDYYLKNVALDPETGKLDIDRITTTFTASDRNYLHMIKGIINQLNESIGGQIPIDDIINLASQQKIDENKVEEILEKLKRTGDIMENRNGFISKL